MNGPGRHVVAIGGGHGLASTLAALLEPTGAGGPDPSITAVVSVADDGGSSGRLRKEFGVPALGDLRVALLALSDHGNPLTRAMAHRFDAGELSGHAMGNLLIAAMVQADGGLVLALDELGRAIGARGRVLPNVVEPVVLCGRTADGDLVEGQVAVMGTTGIERVWLEPEAASPPEVLEAIGVADRIILGPGSLFTSVLAALVAPEIRAAVAASSAQCVYVANLSPELPETAGRDAAGHLAALVDHGITPDVVLADPGAFGGAPAGVGTVVADLADSAGTAHDPVKLATALARLD